MLVQRYYEPDGPDRKVYSIGAQTFGVVRRFPSRSYLERLGTPFTPTGEILDIAWRCGRAFGIDLYGIDVIECDGRPYVVDISAFPWFTGVPDGALRLADYIFAAAERVLRGEPLLPCTTSQAVA
jgi:ribosomal protein S6--L-glutamate ligase